MGYLDHAGLQYLWDKLKEKFAPKSHSHDDRYYTEAEMDGKLNGKVNNNETGANALFSKLTTSWDATPTDDTYFIRQDTGGTNQFGRVKFSTIWAYIRGKTDGIYQSKGSYAASEHTHDDRYYTEAEVDGKLSGKSNIGHTHDDRYYTESEVDTKLNEKSNISHIHLNGTKSGAIDQNTFTTYGVYKIQNCTMTDAYHAPAGEYQFGILQVLDSENNVGEKRILQIYWPHSTAKGNHIWYRMHNSSDINSGWSGWTQIKKKPDTAGTADNATTSNGVKDYNDANRTIKIGYAGAGLTAENLSHVAGYTDSGTKIKDVSKDVLKSQIGLGNYLPLSGGTMSGNITFSNIGNTNTSNKISWSGSTDGADIYYQTTASDQGNLVLNLRDDANCYLRIASNGAFKSYFSPSDGNFHGNVTGNVSGSSGSCTGNSATATTAAKLGRSGNTGVPMTFNWSGQSGQPTWLWGSNDGSNIYVWNPSNFKVNYANSAGSVAWNNVSGRPDLYTKAQVDQLLKKAMYSEGKLVGTGKVTYSYLEDGILVVPSTSDYIKIVNVVNDYTNGKVYTVPLNTKIVIGSTIYTQNGNKDGKITFDTNGKITCVGYCGSPKNGTCTYYIEAYQYY